MQSRNKPWMMPVAKSFNPGLLMPCLLLLFFPILLSAQTTVLWGDSIQVSSTPLPVTAPRVALLADGTPMVTWGTSSSSVSQIWCARFENGTFTTPVPVVQSPNKPVLFGFGGYDVAVSDSQVYVVFEQLQDGIWITRSDDGGLTFSTPIQVQSAISGGYVTISSVVVDGTGNPVVSYIREKTGAIYEVRRSPDGGESFGDPVTANAPAPGGEVCECCSSDLLASGDSVWIVFRNNNQNKRDIWVSRSTDLAASFTLATDVDNTDWQINTCPISGPRMTRMGDSLLTVWMSQASGMSRVYSSSLHAGTMALGQQISFPNLPGPSVAQTVPDIVALEDTVGVVFLEKSKEIVFYHSVNGMTGLNAQPQRIALPNHTLQYPSLAFKNGVFHLVYADATADKVLYRQGALTGNSGMEEPGDEAISVFPNPVTEGSLWVSSTREALRRIQVFDVLGHPVLEERASGFSVQVHTRGLSQGIFFLRIETEKGVSIQKIMVKP